MAMECIFRGGNGNERFRTYYGDTFTKSSACSKLVENVDSTLQRFHDLSIFSSEITKLPCLLLKNGAYRVDGVAFFEVLGKGMVT
jgi:hypothetical protein